MRPSSRTVFAQSAAVVLVTLLAAPPHTRADDNSPAATAEFPPELVQWAPLPSNPVFTAEGPGHWDVKIRERGWILYEDDTYHLWFTGYDGTRAGIKLLGYATSTDGLHWTRWPGNPLVRDHWVEDMMVVRRGDTYYMFCEGRAAGHAELLTSKDRIHWELRGPLDIRAADGTRPAAKPCGTPTVWVEGDTWHLYYERLDLGVWLATSKDPLSNVWTNVQDDPVLVPGPDAYDEQMIALDQVIRHGDAYFAVYHGSGKQQPRTWNTNLARSADLVHWQKYPGNPIVADNKSSGELVPVEGGYRLYTMHDQVDAFELRAK